MEKVYTEPLPDIQMRETEQAFYAGAFQVLGVLNSLAELPDATAEMELGKLVLETEMFLARRGRELAGPRINGRRWKFISNPPPAPSFWIYIVTLHGGPFDGRETPAGNSREVYYSDARYVLNEAGDFVHAPLEQS